MNEKVKMRTKKVENRREEGRRKREVAGGVMVERHTVLSGVSSNLSAPGTDI